MFGRAYKYGFKSQLDFKIRGPFTLFLTNSRHFYKFGGFDELNRIEKESYQIIKEWREFSTIKNWDCFVDFPDWKKGHERYLETVETFNQQDVSDTVFSYFLYKNMPDTRKQKYVEIFQKIYDVKVPKGFIRDYLKALEPEKIRKTGFILWMNYYLRNCVSMELFELDSFDIVLKLGEVWNNLPLEEKCKWQSIIEKNKKKVYLDRENERIY